MASLYYMNIKKPLTFHAPANRQRAVPLSLYRTDGEWEMYITREDNRSRRCARFKWVPVRTTSFSFFLHFYTARYSSALVTLMNQDADRPI